MRSLPRTHGEIKGGRDEVREGEVQLFYFVPGMIKEEDEEGARACSSPGNISGPAALLSPPRTRLPGPGGGSLAALDAVSAARFSRAH